MAVLEVLRRSVVFQRLSDEQVNKMAAISSEEFHPAGSLVYKEGERADKLYIVQKGKVVLDMEADISPQRPPTQVTAVDVVTEGRAMGWSALIHPHIYTLCAFCVEDSNLVAIDAHRLRGLLSKDTAMGYEVMSVIAELIASRLTHTRVLLIGERALNLLKGK
jgi:CRP/FNR family transcriptional regulator, cyclic AMP receptor protein